MKFSLFLLCLSNFIARHNFYTVPGDKPFMYFNGEAWKTMKLNRHRTFTDTRYPRVSHELDVFKTTTPYHTRFYSNKPLAFNSKSYQNYGIIKRASDHESVEETLQIKTERNVTDIVESNVLLSQLLHLIETKYNDTQNTSPSTPLTRNPQAWIRFIFDLSNALREVAEKANASYHKMLMQETTTNFATGNAPNKRRAYEGIDGLLQILSDGADVANEITDVEFREDLDSDNKIYMDKTFPFKMDVIQILKNSLNKDGVSDQDQNKYFDTESADIVSDGIEQIRVH